LNERIAALTNEINRAKQNSQLLEERAQAAEAAAKENQSKVSSEEKRMRKPQLEPDTAPHSVVIVADTMKQTSENSASLVAANDGADPLDNDWKDIAGESSLAEYQAIIGSLAETIQVSTRELAQSKHAASKEQQRTLEYRRRIQYLETRQTEV